MNWIKAHLNWSYGIALLFGLLCAVLAVVTNTWWLVIVLFVWLYIGGELILWAKGERTIPMIVRLMPPVYAIVVLCMRNKRAKKDARMDW